MPVSVGHIVDALSSLGGEAHLDQIVARVCEIAPAPLPEDVGASVRGRIQERCSQAQSYKGGEDLFESVYGVAARRGVWRLRQDDLNPANPDAVMDGADADINAEEGRASLRIHLRREDRASSLLLSRQVFPTLPVALVASTLKPPMGKSVRATSKPIIRSPLRPWTKDRKRS